MRRSALILASLVTLAPLGGRLAADPAPSAATNLAAAAATAPASAEQRLAAVERQIEALLKKVRALRQEAAADARMVVVVPLKYAAAADALKDRFRQAAVTVVVDERTNSLLVSGRAAGIAEVRAALAHLDVAGKKQP
jgi:type II secretory pathway component GspD/PulD (secretin)